MKKPRKTRIKSSRYDVHGDNRYLAFLADLRGIAEDAMRIQNMTVDDLAEEARLHPLTIRHFLAGKTISPRFPTVYRIMLGVNRALSLPPKEGRRRRRK